MPLETFDHVNIRTSNLDALVAWYDNVLGLKKGFRPNFPFPGAWLYLGETAIIHLVGTEAPPSPYTPGEEPRLEHFAFRASDFEAFRATLTEHGVDYQAVEVDDIDTVAVNIRDPDGNHIHVDFFRSEET